jgi:GNAT superfamily N-acetyltransferase
MASYRAARPDDAAALTSVAIASKAHWGYPDVWMEQWRSQLEIRPEQIQQHHFVLAESDDAIVGFSAVFVESSDAGLEHLWVLPQWMGAGIGRRLLVEALQWCARQGLETLTVVSDPGAAPFYERMGARRIGEKPSTPDGRVIPLLQFVLSQGNAEEFVTPA